MKVNHAEFGPTIYGVCAAGWYYFDSPPSELSEAEAVQLVGLLPSPGHVQRAPGGGMDFEVVDGLGWLSRSHVINAQNRVARLDRPPRVPARRGRRHHRARLRAAGFGRRPLDPA